MSKKSLEEQALFLAISAVASSTTLSPGPGTSPSSPKAALQRCCAAWKRAFNVYMESADPKNDMENIWAAKDAGEAYCNAMPMLAGYEGARDFIVCAAHGILIGAIPHEKSGQLLYAAQVALNTLQFGPKPPKTPSK
jgi:hypothetical protein